MKNDLKKLFEPPRPRGRPKTIEEPKRGRPRLDIDYQLVYQLATYQCTKTEIAAALKTTLNSIENDPQRAKRFNELVERGHEEGKAKLRKNQARMSEKNPVMAIWCGKQYLNQSDNPQQATTLDGTVKVVFEDANKDKERLENMENALKNELK